MSTEPVDPVIRAFLGVEQSASGQRWMSRTDQAGQNRALAISQLHGIPELVARVLAGRGVGVDEAPAFLDPTIRNLMPDPSKLTDCDAAAARISKRSTVNSASRSSVTMTSTVPPPRR